MEGDSKMEAQSKEGLRSVAQGQQGVWEGKESQRGSAQRGQGGLRTQTSLDQQRKPSRVFSGHLAPVGTGSHLGHP